MLQQATIKTPPIRSISSTAFAVGGGSPFDSAVSLAVRWMRQVNPAIPSKLSSEAIFDVGGGGEHPARAVNFSYQDGRIWSATIDNPDRSTLGRTWVTEITVAERFGEVHVGTRLLNVTRQSDDSFVPSIPRVVRDIISELSCTADGVALSESPTYIRSEDDLDWLIKLIEHPGRRLPVVVMAEAVNKQPLIRLETFSGRVCGAAHVIGLGNNQTWHFSRRVGRDLTVYDGAVRLYRAGLKLEDADQYAHPLWLPNHGRSGFWSGTPIITRVLASGVSKGTTDYPRFDVVRQAVAERALKERRGDSSDAEMVKLYEEENIALREELAKLRSEQNQWLSDAEAERSVSEAQTIELKTEVHRYRAQNELLKHAIQSGAMPVEREDLTDFSEFGDWINRNISPNIWFSPKALKAVEQTGQYWKPKEIGDAIRLLDDLYVPMRRNKDQVLHNKWKDKLAESGVSLSDCFARSGDLRRFPEYSVNYHNERRWCDQHLKRGGGTDPRSMFRIYFNWHEEDGIIIVGHLPSHLYNNMTN
jgi:hypothetical protein